MKPRPRIERLLNPVVLTAWILAAIMLFVATNAHAADNSNIYDKIKLFSEVLATLKYNYVTPVDADSLIDGAIQGMLSSLDPHTMYFTPEQASSFMTEMSGEYGALGFSLDEDASGYVVTRTLPGYSAEEKGIIAGDCVTKIDGTNIVGVSWEQASSLMRGPVGTHVAVTIKRPGMDTELTFDLDRRLMKSDNVPYAFKLDNGVGYIYVREFTLNVASDFRTKLDALEAQGIRGLIVDMRANPGGAVNEAVDMVNEFIGGNKLVVTSRGQSTAANHEYYTRFNRVRSGYPVIVLVNRYSASAAEIFSGSLQDYDVALVMGETSFGKGSVQTTIPLSSGMLKVTIAKYYLYSGRCIHRDENDRYLRGREVSDSDLAKLEQHRKTDLHYTLKGRPVHGGGGITPDVAVAQDTLTTLGLKLRTGHLLSDFAKTYADAHDVPADFKVNDALRKDFLRFLQEKGVTYSPATLDSTRNYIDTSLTAGIISIKYGEEAGFRAQIPIDRQLQAAISMFDRFPDLNAMFDYAASLKKD